MPKICWSHCLAFRIHLDSAHYEIGTFLSHNFSSLFSYASWKNNVQNIQRIDSKNMENLKKKKDINIFLFFEIRQTIISFSWG